MSVYAGEGMEGRERGKEIQTEKGERRRKRKLMVKTGWENKKNVEK